MALVEGGMFVAGVFSGAGGVTLNASPGSRLFSLDFASNLLLSGMTLSGGNVVS